MVSDWIQTACGKLFNVINPNASMVMWNYWLRHLRPEAQGRQWTYVVCNGLESPQRTPFHKMKCRGSLRLLV